MRAGRLRLQASFQQQTETRDAAGQVVETWTEVVSRRVRLEPLKGAEADKNSGEFATVESEAYVRYDSLTKTLKPYDRMVADGVTYDIRAIVNKQDRNRELVLRVRNDANA